MDNIEAAKEKSPEILAPAGSRLSFLAAVAAGADAVYCGLTQFSARMEAKNFEMEELAALTDVARSRGVRVYVAINTLFRPDEMDSLYAILHRLHSEVAPDALIFQDLAVIRAAQQIGMTAELHLSTLANVSFTGAISSLSGLHGIRRVVLPRELHIEEIKQMSAVCPKELDLEIFVHGALCYGVSGRCYWSSYLGGKSGLRGRCVQPCRRVYRQGEDAGRLFSCRDLSLDVLARTLLPIAKISAWKIEGRKKGPHYVYYTVRAYRLLRDFPDDTAVRKEAVSLLEYALGRKTTHYFFLPQRRWNPIPEDGQTASGLLVGRIKQSGRRSYLQCREELFTGDKLRIGFEDDLWHRLLPIKRGVPRKGKLFLQFPPGKKAPSGTPVFLIDRREKELIRQIDMLAPEPLRKQSPFSKPPTKTSHVAGSGKIQRHPATRLVVFRSPSQSVGNRQIGYWVESVSSKALPSRQARAAWWWLPPVIWPEDEKELMKSLQAVLRTGARFFVLNAPWQVSLFGKAAGLELWAGPFCNISNPAAIDMLKSMGFHGCIVSPELDRKSLAVLPAASALPLGIVTQGNWPLCISRIVPPAAEVDKPFFSPRGEGAWLTKYDSGVWVFPNWPLDLRKQETALESAGYRLVIRMVEPIPGRVKRKERPGDWNYHLKLR